MSDIEPQILSALKTIASFTSVRYIVREAQDELNPEPLPFAVFTTSEKNFAAFQTMCGANLDVFEQTFTVLVFAETAEMSRQLAAASVVALTGIGALDSMETDFEPELRAFVTTLQFL
jgi:hypothetical protein